MAKCKECAYFTDEGKCRGPRKLTMVGYFDEACNDFTTTIPTFDPLEAGKRQCVHCKKVLPLEQFTKNRWGYTHTCRDCYKIVHGKESTKAALSARKKKLRESKEKKEAAKAKPVQETKPAPHAFIRDCPSGDLIEELKRRGFAGILTKTEEYAL